MTNTAKKLEQDVPSIWIGCLAAYNDGRLHGEWVEVTTDPDDLWEAIHRIQKTSPCPNVIRQDFTCSDCGHEFLSTQHYADGSFAKTCPGYTQKPTGFGKCESESIVAASKPYRSSEEHFIAGSDGFPDGFTVEEYHDIDELCEVVEVLESDEGDAIVAFMGHHCGNYSVSEAKGKFDDGVYRGKWNSLEDYMEDYLESAGTLESIPENLRYYFDVKAYARDMEINGDVYTVDASGGVYVFDGHA